MKFGSDGELHHEQSMPHLGFCPFSLLLFLTSAAGLTFERRRLRARRLPKCQVVFVLGGPGAGKGTQCQLLTERKPGWAHLSAGDLLRAERQKGGPLGDLINERIANGQLVPSEVTCQLIENAMQRCYRDSNHATTKFLIDGFPRSRGNVEAWDATMSRHDVAFVLVLECPEDTLIGRLLERGKSSGRTDDNMNTIRKRLHTFQDETAPIVDLYGTQVRKISSDASIEEVYKKVDRCFADL